MFAPSGTQRKKRYPVTVLTILAVLIGLGLLGYGCYAIHEYAERMYGFTVFSIPHLAFMVVPIALFVGAFFFKESDEALLAAIRGGNLDVILVLALATLSLVGFVWYLADQTNIWVALFVATVLLIAAIVVIAVVLYLAQPGKKKR